MKLWSGQTAALSIYALMGESVICVCVHKYIAHSHYSHWEYVEVSRWAPSLLTYPKPICGVQKHPFICEERGVHWSNVFCLTIDDLLILHLGVGLDLIANGRWKIFNKEPWALLLIYWSLTDVSITFSSTTLKSVPLKPDTGLWNVL